jgi:hypothetical protein
MKRRSTKRDIEARHQKITALRQKLDEYAGQLSDEDRAQILARFAGYSARNAMLIAMQRPAATEVHGFVEWRKLGRQVRKGESGIAVLAPIPPRGESTDEPAGSDGEQGEATRSRMRFRLAYLFDIDQTDPITETAPVPVAG